MSMCNIKQQSKSRSKTKYRTYSDPSQGPNLSSSESRDTWRDARVRGKARAVEP